MKIGNEEVESFMTMKYSFVGVRLIDDSMSPTSWNLSVDLVAIDKDNKNVKELEEIGNLAYQKLSFWLQTTLSNIVVVNTQNEDAMAIASSVDNIMMHCPDEPTDDIIVQMIHSKLNMIANGHIFVGKIVIESTDTPATYTFCPTAKHGYTLPSKMGGYVNCPALHRKPWWLRSDGFCFEFLKPKGVKEKLTDLYGDIRDPLEAFEAELLNFSEDIEFEFDNSPAEIIQVDKWVPKKV